MYWPLLVCGVKIAQEKAAANPDIATDYFYVDNTAMQLVVNPAQFDVIVTTNLFGDILSDEGAVISGSIGFYHLHPWVLAQHCMSQSTVLHQTLWVKTWRTHWVQSCPQL